MEVLHCLYIRHYSVYQTIFLVVMVACVDKYEKYLEQ